jgi:chromosome segregation ATPase
MSNFPLDFAALRLHFSHDHVVLYTAEYDLPRPGLSAMAMPALMLELETPVEERVARLEANVEHIRSDISDVKIDLRRLNDKVESIDQKLITRIDGVDEKLTTKIDGVEQRLSAKIDGVDEKLTTKIDGVEQRLSAKIDGVDEKLTTRIDGVEQRLSTKIDSVDEKLTSKIDSVDQRLSGKADALKDSVASLALTVERSFASLKIGRALDRVWWLLMSGAMLGIMARAFKWI